MIVVVFDTVVFVRGLLNPRSFWGKLLYDHASSYHLFLSYPILIELLEVIQRPKLVAKYPLKKHVSITRVLEIIKNASIVTIDTIHPISRDPNDDMFLATAAAADADYLISADKDLLDLKNHGKTKIISAEAFLAILQNRS